MSIELLSINIGELQNIPGAKSKTPTGIYKLPVSGPVMVEAPGLRGDRIGSKKYHGGPDQAAYVFSQRDYDWWGEELGFALPFGTFGENFTVSSLGIAPPRIGDLWNIGEVVLEVSAPRIPCATLAARMDDPGFVKKFAKANRGGFYARVVQPGPVEVGMTVLIEPTPLLHPTVDELFAMCHQRSKDPALVRRALRSPLASRLRGEMEKWLARLEGLGEFAG